MEQKAQGLDVWQQPMVQLRLPMLFNLRSDPFERAATRGRRLCRWFVEHAFVLVPAQALVAQHLASFQQFPPRQRPGCFSVEQAMEKLRNPPSSNYKSVYRDDCPVSGAPFHLLSVSIGTIPEP